MKTGVFRWMDATEKERREAQALANEYANGYMAGWMECMEAIREAKNSREVKQWQQ